jgi:hypothetical protein
MRRSACRRAKNLALFSCPASELYLLRVCHLQFLNEVALQQHTSAIS